MSAFLFTGKVSLGFATSLLFTSCKIPLKSVGVSSLGLIYGLLSWSCIQISYLSLPLKLSMPSRIMASLFLTCNIASMKFFAEF